MKDDQSNLARLSAIAFLWGTGGSIVRIFLQLGIQVALARLLGPQTYGIFSLGVLVVGLATYFADFGLAYGLIQKQNVSDEEIRFIWTWQCMLGIVVCATLLAIANPLAKLFDKPESSTVFAWLSLVCLLNALVAPSTNLLKKALDYRTLQVAQISGYVVGYLGVGLPLAKAGAGVDALIAAMVVQATLVLVVQYAKVRHPLGLRFRVHGGLAVLGYGSTVLATNIVNWLLTSADKLMVARLFPAEIVGAYNIAFNLVNSPAAAAYSNLQSVVFSAGARLQDDLQALRSAFLKLLSLVLLTAFPLFAVLAVGSTIAIDGIYGARWLEATPFLRVFAFVMPCLLVWGISTPVLWNTGHTTLEAWLQVPMVLVWAVVLFLVGVVASMPALAVAEAAGALLFVRAVIMAVVAGRILRVTGAEALRTISGGVVMSALMILFTYFSLVPLANMVSNPQIRLAALLASGGAAYLLLVLILGPLLLEKPVARMLSSSSSRLPKLLAFSVVIAARERIFLWPK